MSVKEKIKQYGIKESIVRLILAIFRLFGIKYDSFLYMGCFLDSGVIKEIRKKNDFSNVKMLTFSDFKNGDLNYFTNSKLQNIYTRLESGLHYAYGIYEGDVLIYSTWISRSKIVLNSKISYSLPLSSNQALLEDSYCHPDYRGLGLHTKMNLYRMMKISEMNCNEIIAIVVFNNLPAIKTQLKSGFKKLKRISFLSVFGKVFYFEKIYK